MTKSEEKLDLKSYTHHPNHDDDDVWLMFYSWWATCLHEMDRRERLDITRPAVRMKWNL
jgi:hypothetical protein